LDSYTGFEITPGKSSRENLLLEGKHVRCCERGQLEEKIDRELRNGHSKRRCHTTLVEKVILVSRKIGNRSRKGYWFDGQERKWAAA